jgi:hypothetical protein
VGGVPKLRFPDFLCVGFQKCGTTWLQENLCAHPGVYLPECKEVNYFAHRYLPQHRGWIEAQRINQIKDALTRLDPATPGHLESIERWAHQANAKGTDSWYGGIFAAAEPETVTGDISPAYACLPPEGIEHVRRLAPDARILMMVRDPIDRVASHVQHILSYWTLSGPREVPVPPVRQILKHPDIWAWSDYAAAYEAWQAAFPGRVFVYDQDQLGRNPKGLLREICTDLGLGDFNFPHPDKVVFGSARSEDLSEVRDVAHGRLREPIERFEKMFPEIGSKWRAAHYGA